MHFSAFARIGAAFQGGWCCTPESWMVRHIVQAVRDSLWFLPSKPNVEWDTQFIKCMSISVTLMSLFDRRLHKCNAEENVVLRRSQRQYAPGLLINESNQKALTDGVIASVHFCTFNISQSYSADSNHISRKSRSSKMRIIRCCFEWKPERLLSYTWDITRSTIQCRCLRWSTENLHIGTFWRHFHDEVFSRALWVLPVFFSELLVSSHVGLDKFPGTFGLH